MVDRPRPPVLPEPEEPTVRDQIAVEALDAGQMLSQPMKALLLMNVEPVLDSANPAAARAALARTDGAVKPAVLVAAGAWVIGGQIAVQLV